MPGSTWVSAAKQAKVPKDGVLAVYPKGVAVLLVAVGGVLHAIANRCLHTGCPLEGGARDGFIITCPCHDWSFDVRSGEMVEAPQLRIPVLGVRIEGEDVMVELPEAGL
jgi:nitrite reductase/ring-hydroxylating ferredoxin subunit